MIADILLFTLNKKLHTWKRLVFKSNGFPFMSLPMKVNNILKYNIPICSRWSQTFFIQKIFAYITLRNIIIHNLKITLLNSSRQKFYPHIFDFVHPFPFTNILHFTPPSLPNIRPKFRNLTSATIVRADVEVKNQKIYRKALERRCFTFFRVRGSGFIINFNFLLRGSFLILDKKLKC